MIQDHDVKLMKMLKGETSFPLTIDEFKRYLDEMKLCTAEIEFMEGVALLAEQTWFLKLSATVPTGYIALCRQRPQAIEASLKAITVPFPEAFAKETERLEKSYFNQMPYLKLETAVTSQIRPMDILCYYDPLLSQIHDHIDQKVLPGFMKHVLNTNLGNFETAIRRNVFLFASTSFIVMNALFIHYQMSSWLRLTSFPVCYLACVAWWQYRAKFCVMFGAMKVTKRGDGHQEPQAVQESCVLRNHALQARRIYIQTFASLSILMIIALALPPWSFQV
jgi:hypothetical protein